MDMDKWIQFIASLILWALIACGIFAVILCVLTVFLKMLHEGIIFNPLSLFKNANVTGLAPMLETIKNKTSGLLDTRVRISISNSSFNGP